MTDKIEFNVLTGEVVSSEYTQEEIEYREFLEQQLRDKFLQLEVDNGN